MYSEHLRHPQNRKRFLILLLSVVMALSCITTFLHADEEIAQPRVQRSIVKQLRYIEANTAKEYFLNLGIGTDINRLGSMNALIITTDNDLDRIKASSLISLIDSKTKFELIRLKVDSVPATMEKTSDVEAMIEGIAIGTFRNPPTGIDTPRAIIDVQGSDLIALVPNGYAPPVVAVLEDMYSSKVDAGKLPDAVKSNMDIQKTLMELATLSENETGITEETNFINAELLEALTTVEKEVEAITVTEKPVEKVGTEPAVIAEQVVVAETPERTAIEAEPRTMPAGVTVANNDVKTDEPSMAEILAMLGTMTSDSAGAEVAAKPSTAATPAKPSTAATSAKPREPIVSRTSEPVKEAGSEKTSRSEVGSGLPEAELETTINLPTKVFVIDLLKLVGEQLGLNYMYDPKEISGEVTLFINDGKVQVGQLYALLENVLQFKGFVMTRRGKFVTIVPKAKISEIDPEIMISGEEVQTGNIVVTQTFDLEYIDTKTAIVMLDSMKLGISVQDIPVMKSLIITGYASRMQRIAEVLKMVDKPGKKRVFQFRYLKYTMATSLVSKVQALAKELGTVSISIGSKTTSSTTIRPTSTPTTAAARAAAARAAAAARRTPTASTASKTSIGKAAVDGEVYLDIDDRTNRILMIGLTDDIDVVSSLIDSLDIPQSGLKEVRQYNIVNVEAEYVIDVLGELGAMTPGARPAASPAPGSKTPSRPVTPTRGASSSDGPQISLLEESNSLLINASPEEHDKIAAIIRYVDVPKHDLRIIKEYEIESVDISEVLNTMLELGVISTMPGSPSPTRRTSTPTTSKGTTTSASRSSLSSSTNKSSSADPISGEPMISVLTSANSLLVNATTGQHMQIAMIIAHVDRDPTDTALPYVIYALTSQTAVDLKGILDEVIHAKLAANPAASGSPKTPGTPATSKIMSTQNTSGSTITDKERIEIVSDEATNSLIVYANKNNQVWVGKLIEELDKYRPQVLLDVTLVEITQDDVFNFDLDLVSKAGGFLPGGAMESSLSALTTGTFPANDIFESRTTSGGDGFGSAFYSDRHVQALFKIMDKKGYGRVLARPSLLVKDNEPGQIKTEKTRYVAQEKSSTTYTGTAGSTPNVSSDVTFEAYPSGITLDITPHISSEKLLQLEITLDRKDFIDDGEKTITIGPEDNKRTVPRPYDEISSTITTWAILPDGATIILGGIETVSQNKKIKKVPILGDIPLLGLLFREIDETDIQSKLYVFVKAHIINPGDELTGNSDIERISLKKRNLFEEDEKKFQGLRAVPGIKPNPMQPQRILEDDDYLQEIKSGLQVGGDSISIPVATPAARGRGKVLAYEEYIRKLKEAELNESNENAELENVLEENALNEPRSRQLMERKTRVEVVLPD